MNDIESRIRDFLDEDVFEDVRETERKQLEHVRNNVSLLKAAIRIADGLASLESAPGHTLLRQALEDMLSHRNSELLMATTDRSAAVAQGRCLELRSILTIVSDAKKKREALAIELEIAENTLRDLEKKRKPLKGDNS